MRKQLSLLIVFCLLFSAVPALAATDGSIGELKQMRAGVDILLDAYASAQKTGHTNTNEVVYVLETEGSYSQVQAEAVTGYVLSSQLKALSASAKAQSLSKASSDNTLYGAQSSKSTRLATIRKSDVVEVLLDMGSWIAVRYEGQAGFVQSKNYRTITSSSATIGYITISAGGNIAALPGTNTGRLGTAAAGTAYAKLGAYGEKTIVLYNGNAGLVETSRTKALTEDTSTSKYVRAVAKATVRQGPSKGNTALGSLLTGEIVKTLAIMDGKTIVIWNSRMGFVDTALTERVTPSRLARTKMNVGSNAKLYAGASTSSAALGEIKKGQTVERIGTSGNWAILYYDGNLVYVQSKLLLSPSVALPLGAPVQQTLPTTQTSGLRDTDVISANDTEEDYDAKVREFIAVVNQYRAKEGLPALIISSALMRGAEIRAVEITRKFSHTRPDGTLAYSVAQGVLGENCERGEALSTGAAAAHNLMTSIAHELNALRPDYVYTGVAYVVHNGKYYWVQLFG